MMDWEFCAVCACEHVFLGATLREALDQMLAHQAEGQCMCRRDTSGSMILQKGGGCVWYS